MSGLDEITLRGEILTRAVEAFVQNPNDANQRVALDCATRINKIGNGLFQRNSEQGVKAVSTVLSQAFRLLPEEGERPLVDLRNELDEDRAFFASLTVG